MRQLKFQFESELAPLRGDDSTDAHDWRRFLRKLRWQLGLSQEEFANAYRIDLARLIEAESGATAPDETLGAYLMMIHRTPELIARLWMAAA